MPNEPSHLVIEGLTRDGKVFRPSDWAERLVDTAATYGADRRSRRTHHSGPERRRRQTAFLQVQMIGEMKCVVVDLRLREANPAAYAFLTEFVETNQLRWRKEGASLNDMPEANR